ncbi:response regulator [Rudanella paleaurantiibacter]|uniref:Response regulator n=1 Tax=Rudanella paleaurantiibacter TaxID=2614655 RepID=A0A7J5TUY3_9BACT|nr:response regulator transcription factor [Rudanella paleaurantiibacter]KAB7727959.1 response regulator [Rudanella paleaurantiibacter]
MQRILIADDHRLFADGLRFLFQFSELYEVVEVVTLGGEVLPTLQRQSIDLLLLDVTLPDLPGPEVARSVRAFRPDLPILAISMETEAATVQAMLRAGVNGYCPKTAHHADLMSALDAVCGGEIYLDPSLQHVLLYPSEPLPPVPTEEPVYRLTPREQEVAHLLVQGLSNTAIATRTFTSPRTVETHRKNIYAKLGVHNAVELTTRLLQRA